MANPDVFSQAFISLNDLKAIFARWAIAQSPITVPDRLGEALDDLANLWRLIPGYGAIGKFEFAVLPRSDVGVWLDAFLEHSAIAQSWGQPQNPDDAKTPWDNRNNSIDLGALRVNVVTDLLHRSDAE